MLGEDMMEPLVVNFHVKERLEGPTGAVEVCVGSARHIGQFKECMAALQECQYE